MIESPGPFDVETSGVEEIPEVSDDDTAELTPINPDQVGSAIIPSRVQGPLEIVSTWIQTWLESLSLPALLAVVLGVTGLLCLGALSVTH